MAEWPRSLGLGQRNMSEPFTEVHQKGMAKLWHRLLSAGTMEPCLHLPWSFLSSLQKLATWAWYHPHCLIFLAALMGDWRRTMVRDFKGNVDALLAISFDVNPSSLCCHFTALTWQWRLFLTWSYCQERETGIFDVSNLVLFCVSLVL